MPLENLLDDALPDVSFAIATAARGATAAMPPEPRFDTSELVEFGEPERLDPNRASADPQEPPPTPPQTASRLGMAGSVGIHLLPLLLLATWPVAPADVSPPIPVQLVVLNEPEPPPPPPPPPEAKPPSGRLASVEIGDLAAPRDKPAATAPAAPEPPQEAKPAAAPRPPKPPAPALVSALPKPAPAPEPDLKPAEPEPEPLPLEKPAIKERVAAPAPPKAHPAPHHGDVPGPAASRSEYLAYCMTLVRQHYGLLPPSFLAGRRGLTVINILVLGDGTIARVDVARHSGYADIDGRVEQMIAAVRRFPPLPQWIQRSSITMTYELAFPEGLAER